MNWESGFGLKHDLMILGDMAKRLGVSGRFVREMSTVVNPRIPGVCFAGEGT